MARLSYNDLKPGVLFVKDGAPHEVLEYSFVRMQQRKPVVQLKIKNLLSGKVLDYTAHQMEEFEEAEIDIAPVKFIYAHRDEYWFSVVDNKKERFSLGEDIVGDAGKFLKKDLEVRAFKFNGEIINIEPPVKVDLMVTEAPPGLKGNTAQGGTKLVTLETGAKVDAPLFINEGDIIRVNTVSGEYVERAEKSLNKN